MIPYKQLSLAEIFTDCQEKLDNDKSTLMKLFRFPLETIFMHQRAEPVNTLCKPFYGP